MNLSPALDDIADEEISFQEATSLKNKISAPSEEEIEDEEDISAIIGADDPDVVALPSINSVLKHLSLSLPSKKSVKASTEVKLKQAVISCADMIAEQKSSKS